MRKDFVDEIKEKVPDSISDFNGVTNSASGLQDGFDEIEDTSIPAGQNVTKVAVFFTDGLANTFPYSRSCSGGGGVSSFGSFESVNGSTKNLTASNIEDEASVAALAVAKSMRAANITVFSVGLGGAAVDQDFLRAIANDPTSSTYDGNAPSGTAFFPDNANDLSVVFQTVAAKILLRLSE